MASELRFPMGASTPINPLAMEDLLNLAKRVTASGNRQAVLEIFKEHFCRVSGDYYGRSSNLDWAESDFRRNAKSAAPDGPGFIAAFADACEQLSQSGSATPDHVHINKILENHLVPFQIVNNVLVKTDEYISPPEPEMLEATVVARALADAKALIGQSSASSAIDRTHTALHGYLINLCKQSSLEVSESTTTAKAFKVLRENHSAFEATGPRSAEVTRVLQAMATSIDAFSTIRNKASMAHANELLDEPEATAIVNSMYTIFRYIQDCLSRDGA